MTPISIAILLVGVICAGGRNALSKSISGAGFGERRFFLLQAAIFLSGAVLLFALNVGALAAVSPFTLFLAVLYGAALVLSQWCYTAALKSGNTSVCATVYAFGFILPTVTGMLFFSESVTVCKLLGIAAVVPVILLSGRGKQAGGAREKMEIAFLVFIVVAMLANGGLGIVQKLHQSSPAAAERDAFLLLSFLLAGAASLVGCLASHPAKNPSPVGAGLLRAAGVGLCYALCNLATTTLAAIMESSVYFPVYNVGSIFCSFLFGMLFFGEKFNRRTALILAIGTAAILLINLPF